MNERENLQQIHKLWIGFAAYYQVPITNEQIKMYAEDCKEHRADTIAYAMQVWRKNPKHQRMPLPGQLLEVIDGGNSRTSATALTDAIVGALKRHGRYWEQDLTGKAYWTGSWEGDARRELGDLAVDMIKQQGGWDNFVDSWEAAHRNESAFKAQLRDAIDAAITSKRSQVVRFPRSELPDPAGPGSQAQLDNLVHLVAEKERP